MENIYEAIERLSALLSFRLERCAQKKGYAVHYSGYTIQPQPGLLIKLYHTSVHLPRGYTANFQPRHEADEGGESWHIDIQRVDGVLRVSWSEGLSLKKHGEEWGIFYGKELINADHIGYLLEELQLPGPSGLALAITRLWTVRFGRPSFDLAQAIEVLNNVDHMDLIYDALLDQRSRAQCEGLIRNPAPLYSAPQTLKYLPREDNV